LKGGGGLKPKKEKMKSGFHNNRDEGRNERQVSREFQEKAEGQGTCGATQ